jgi:hypothetical protein
LGFCEKKDTQQKFFFCAVILMQVYLASGTEGGLVAYDLRLECDVTVPDPGGAQNIWTHLSPPYSMVIRSIQRYMYHAEDDVYKYVLIHFNDKKSGHTYYCFTYEKRDRLSGTWMLGKDSNHMGGFLSLKPSDVMLKKQINGELSRWIPPLSFTSPSVVPSPRSVAPLPSPRPVAPLPSLPSPRPVAPLSSPRPVALPQTSAPSPPVASSPFPAAAPSLPVASSPFSAAVAGPFGVAKRKQPEVADMQDRLSVELKRRIGTAKGVETMYLTLVQTVFYEYDKAIKAIRAKWPSGAVKLHMMNDRTAADDGNNDKNNVSRHLPIQLGDKVDGFYYCVSNDGGVQIVTPSSDPGKALLRCWNDATETHTDYSDIDAHGVGNDNFWAIKLDETSTLGPHFHIINKKTSHTRLLLPFVGAPPPIDSGSESDDAPSFGVPNPCVAAFEDLMFGNSIAKLDIQHWIAELHTLSPALEYDSQFGNPRHAWSKDPHCLAIARLVELFSSMGMKHKYINERGETKCRMLLKPLQLYNWLQEGKLCGYHYVRVAFHGTSDPALDNIFSDGTFNMSFSGSHANVYGPGAYVSLHDPISTQYNKSERYGKGACVVCLTFFPEKINDYEDCKQLKTLSDFSGRLFQAAGNYRTFHMNHRKHMQGRYHNAVVVMNKNLCLPIGIAASVDAAV